MFNEVVRELPKKPLFQSRDGNWNDLLPTIVKQYFSRTRFSTKIKPVQASFKFNEGFVYKSLFEKKQKKNLSLNFTISFVQQI